MKTDIADRWVAALRSGEYQQAQEQLRIEKAGRAFSFCCLGVLCDLHSKETGTPWVDAVDEYMGEYLRLPDKVALWAGMHNEGRLAPPVNGVDRLAALNDYLGLTFAQIADVIEAQKETL